MEKTVHAASPDPVRIQSPEFLQFHRAQQELNFLFWTTEICYALVQGKVLPQLSQML
jgi:hypothetical protein